jgi:hypothetical protein
VSATLGRLLRVLHTVPVGRVDGLVDADDQPLPQWLEGAAELVDGLGSGLPARFAEPVRAYLAAPPPHGGHPLVFSYNGPKS